MSSNIPRPEYPRPDFERTDWLNLNGEWEFEFDDENIGEKCKWWNTKSFSKKIMVPFCFQSELSGINDTGMHEVMWYKRSFGLSDNFSGERVFLNFGAVDFYTKVWVNDIYVGSHKGGYSHFNFEISSLLKENGNTVVVRVEDKYDTEQPRGKQYWKSKPDRCWYTATSGIWQTVWLESTGEVCIDKIRITPDIDHMNILVELFLDHLPYELELTAEVCYKGDSRNKTGSNAGRVTIEKGKYYPKKYNFPVNERVCRFTINMSEVDEIDEIHHWTPEHPNLYNIELDLSSKGIKLDHVKSYFGMRKIEVQGDQILLNNRPLYQKLVLDQGYWKESLLTPPSDEAIQYDIEMTKKLGFNGARKHQKIEDPRYYYWADRMGLLVWGEMPSAYSFNSDGIENITREWVDFVNRDYNHPCIITWVPLNESWGVRNIYTNKSQQDYARGLYYLIKSMDQTRLISTNDGWEMVKSDICAIHDYEGWGEGLERKFSHKDKLLNTTVSSRMLYAQDTKYEGEPIMVTEYGGIAFESNNAENWGYNGAVKDEESFLKRYGSLTNTIKDTSYICGYCYTQLTDVMQEINGLMTADRKLKIDSDKVKEINR